MRLRLAMVVMVLALASAVRADDAQIAKLAKDLSTGNTAAQLQAADDLAEFGAKAKSAVPVLIKALGTPIPKFNGTRPARWGRSVPIPKRRCRR